MPLSFLAVPIRLLCLLLLLSCPLKAQDLDTLPANQWELGIALGVGHLDNPLADKGDIRYFLVPQLAYYGDWGYFDNGDLAFTLYDDGDNQLYLSTGVSEDALYFGSWDRIGVTPPVRTAVDCTACPFTPADEPLYMDHNPGWTWLGGLAYSHYGDWGFLRLRLLNDMLGRHDGAFASLRLGKAFTFHGQWQLSLGADWKSAELVDYYYGTESQVVWLKGYQGRSAVDWVLAGQWLYPLGDNWGLLVNLHGRRLGSGIANSPLVNDRTVLDSFIGIAVTF
ncbi:MltA-interacting MipA family protein [Gallaecimonas xiamenensis 3-C-1]|uniref:MltA-interacting MipA family protein n=1 Tax=Gallaecimonas xiamenensis 3-C-1 TaxID=745411 RepID=K2JPC8_9GAMM|nr:MltA-interacting MipA family protein [Gallaecimonas xiamenensis 3-C-1]